MRVNLPKIAMMTHKNTSDEIDLTDLLSWCINLLNKNRLLIIVCFAITIAGSIVFYLKMPRVYESKMMLRSDILTESYASRLAVNIRELIDDRNYNLISKMLYLSEGEAGHLVQIKIESALQDKAPVPEESQRLFLLITVEVTDNSILPKLQSGLVRFIEENEFVRVRVEQRKKYFGELVNKIGEEIEKLEILKEKISAGTFKSDGNTILVDPSEPFLKTVELYEQLFEYKEKLELVSSTHVVEGFIPLNRPVKPRLSLSLGAGLLAGLLLSGFLIFFRFLSRLTKNPSPQA